MGVEVSDKTGPREEKEKTEMYEARRKKKGIKVRPKSFKS